jgi:hypothetical protein
MGKTWKSIRNNLPARTLLWRIVQDHEKENLMFLGTEFGVYFTTDGGTSWNSLNGGMPTIPVRDLAIQRRENDLVAATFGRGFYVLDDYSFLREVNKDELKQGVQMYSARKAWWYIPKAAVSFRNGSGAQGASYFTAPNPPYGATFTYHVGEEFKTEKDKRKEKERKLEKEQKEVKFPGWEQLEKERRQEGPELWLIIRDADDEVVQKIHAPSGKGFHRATWDLRYPGESTVSEIAFDTKTQPRGYRTIPGEYSATLEKIEDGESMVLDGPKKFLVEQLYNSSLESAEPEVAQVFWKEVADFQGSFNAVNKVLNKSINRTKAMKVALARTSIAPGELDQRIYSILQDLYQLDHKMNGDASKREVGEKTGPTIQQRLNAAQSGIRISTYGPTPNLMKTLSIAKEEFKDIEVTLKEIAESRMPRLEADLQKVGAPWIEGQKLPD